MKEEWKDVVGYEGYYRVSSLGRIKRITRSVMQSHSGKIVPHIYPSRILKPWLCSSGYHTVSLCKDGNPSKFMIHRLVCWAFHGKPPTSDHTVNHKNADKTDNQAMNLEWVTQAENNEHAKSLGLIPNPPVHIGVNNLQSKLTPVTVRYIRSKCIPGDTHRGFVAIANMLGVTPRTITLAYRRQTWKHID